MKAILGFRDGSFLDARRPHAAALGIFAALGLGSCAPSAPSTDQASSAASAGAELAKQTRETLTKYCARCHGEGSPGFGGMNYITDLRALVARGKVVPSDPSGSVLLERLIYDEMPPPNEQPRPTAEDTDLVKRWILAGAPAESSAGELVTYPAVEAAVLADLDTLPPARARLTRYFTIAQYLNVGATGDERDAIVRSFARIVNSLSQNKEIVVPTSVRRELGLYRIALDDYGWSRKSWEDLVTVYPYVARDPSPTGKKLAAKTGSRLPIARVDWLAKKGLVPPLYYDFLNIPLTLDAHERQIGFSILSNIENRRVVRAGFSQSGVSAHNRVIERHSIPDGGYWLSYDFRSDEGQSNIFLNPIGPGGASGFVQAGGEVIYNLPNGLQAYSLLNGRGDRIDAGPTDIVFDPTRPPGEIRPGLSCMGCHAGGILRKANEITVEGSASLPESVKRAVAELYPPQATMNAAYGGDTKRYREALAIIDAKTPAASPPVNTFLFLVDDYDTDVDAAKLAAELGIARDDWPEFVRKLPDASLRSIYLPTVTSGAPIKRITFEALFPSTMRFALERNLQ